MLAHCSSGSMRAPAAPTRAPTASSRHHLPLPHPLRSPCCVAKPGLLLPTTTTTTRTPPPPAAAAGSAGNASPPARPRVLQGVEFAALSVAAGCQAIALVSTASRQWQRQADASAAQARGSDARVHQLVVLQRPLEVLSAAGSGPGLQLVTNTALLLGLLCGAALRYLHPRPALGGGAAAAVAQPGGGPMATGPAAVRLAALEVAAQQSAAQLAAAARQTEKLQARVRLATVDLKAPLRSVQAASAQQAGALAQLSQQQAALQRQVEDGQMLIGALQGLAAKQFKVSAEALQQLKQGQAQLGTSTSKAVAGLTQQQAKLQAQHAQLQQQLRQTQQHLRTLEAAGAWSGQQQQNHHHQQQQPESASGSSSCAKGGAAPDPWRPNGAPLNGASPAADGSKVA